MVKRSKEGLPKYNSYWQNTLYLLKAMAGYEKKMINTKLWKTAVYFKKGGFKDIQAMKEKPENEAFARMMSGSFQFRKDHDFKKLMKDLMPSVKMASRALRVEEVEDAIVEDAIVELQEQAAVYEVAVPASLQREIDMLEEMMPLVDKMEGSIPDDVDADEFATSLEYGMTEICPNLKDSSMQNIMVLLKKVRSHDMAALDELVQLLSTVTADIQVSGIRQQEWANTTDQYTGGIQYMDVTTYTELMYQIAGSKDEKLIKILKGKVNKAIIIPVQPAMYPSPEESEDLSFNPIAWFDQNTREWQDYIADPDVLEMIQSVLDCGEDQYTDTPQYSFMHKLVEDFQPWNRDMRDPNFENDPAPHIVEMVQIQDKAVRKSGSEPEHISSRKKGNWVSQFKGEVSNLKHTMEEETKLMEAGKNRTVYGLLAEYEKAADKAAKISREKTLAKVKGKVYACEMLLWMSGIAKVKGKYEFALLGKEVQV
jgi:hypothetical protein